MRSQVKVMGNLTNEKIEDADLEREQFEAELRVAAKHAQAIQSEEDKYKSTMKVKLESIRAYLKKVHEVLGATHKEPELEKILRDLDQVSENVGLMENGEAVQVARTKTGVTNQDLVARQMKTANREIERVEALEEEREHKTAVDKLSVVKLAHKLKDVMGKMEDARSHEKSLLTQEIIEMRDSYGDRERRLQKELKSVKEERDSWFVRLTTLDPNREEDREKLSDLVSELKRSNDSSENSIAKENKSLLEKTKKLHDKLRAEAPKDKSKVYKKGQGQRVPVKKAAFLTPSKQVDRQLNQKTRKLK